MSVDAVAAVLAESPSTTVAIVGPTASGKSALALELAARVSGEIVSADSVQVYRGFDIGSGKPTAEELAQAPHHLVDVCDPLDALDAAQFVARARAAIADVRARGRTPIVCGGTFLWVKALFWGLAEAAPANEALRAQYREVADRDGAAALHDRLRSVDPAIAERLHPNDFVRVSRALEVFESTGKRLSDAQREHGFAEPWGSPRLFAVRHAPEVLTERIRARADAWLQHGWIDEVRALDAAGYGAARAMTSVGYREVLAHVRGELGRDELLERVVRSTRVFARRQRTWLGHADVTWLDQRSSA
jgi:tRNA dimethylallyltransferase